MCKAESVGSELAWWYQCCRLFFSALCFSISSTSWRIHFPRARKERSTVESMSLVQESAIWAALWTHLIITPSLRRSFTTNASSMVLYSVHSGMHVFWRRSYRLFQSTTAKRLLVNFWEFLQVSAMQGLASTSRPNGCASNWGDLGPLIVQTFLMPTCLTLLYWSFPRTREVDSRWRIEFYQYFQLLLKSGIPFVNGLSLL